MKIKIIDNSITYDYGNYDLNASISINNKKIDAHLLYEPGHDDVSYCRTILGLEPLTEEEIREVERKALDVVKANKIIKNKLLERK